MLKYIIRLCNNENYGQLLYFLEVLSKPLKSNSFNLFKLLLI